MTQRDLAGALGISLGKANYCLKALLEKGSIKIHRFSKNGNEWPYTYALTPSGITEKASIAARFLRRKMNEYQHLKSEIETLQREVASHRRAGGFANKGERSQRETKVT